MKNQKLISGNNQEPGNTVRARSETPPVRQRGAVLIAAVALTLIGSMLIGAVVLNVRNVYSLSWARTNSEAALLLAEGAINDEISYINVHLYDANSATRSSRPTLASGQPYKGRPGSVTGATGNFWVFTSSDAAGTTAWDGTSSTLYITANAKVNGAWRKVQIGGPNMYTSIFSTFGVFGTNNNNGNNGTSITQNSGSSLDVTGNVGTNGGVTTNSSPLTFTTATNANSSNTQPKFTSSTVPIYTQSTPQIYPSSTEVLWNTLHLTWTQLALSNSNSLIRTYRPSGPALTPAGTQTNGITDGNLYANKWATANQGSNGNTKVLIFPPGDYYFLNCWLDYANNYEIIIDDQGLTVGGNPTKRPIRWWIRNAATVGDLIAIPITSTWEIVNGTSNPSSFRIIYGSTSSLTIDRRNNPGHDSVYGAVYAVSDTGSLLPSNVRLRGKNNQQKCNLVGGLVSDTITIDGPCTINYPGATISNVWDAPAGVFFNGGYTCSGS